MLHKRKFLSELAVLKLTSNEIQLEANDDIKRPIIMRLTLLTFLWMRNNNRANTTIAPKNDIALKPKN
jgi:hypothetical protein